MCWNCWNKNIKNYDALPKLDEVHIDKELPTSDVIKPLTIKESIIILYLLGCSYQPPNGSSSKPTQPFS